MATLSDLRLEEGRKADELGRVKDTMALVSDERWGGIRDGLRAREKVLLEMLATEQLDMAGFSKLQGRVAEVRCLLSTTDPETLIRVKDRLERTIQDLRRKEGQSKAMAFRSASDVLHKEER